MQGSLVSISIAGESTTLDTTRNVTIRRNEEVNPGRKNDSVRESSVHEEMQTIPLNGEMEAVPFDHINDKMEAVPFDHIDSLSMMAPLGVLSFDTDNVSVISNITATPIVVFWPSPYDWADHPPTLNKEKGPTSVTERLKQMLGSLDKTVDGIIESFEDNMDGIVLKVLDSIDDKIDSACQETKIEMALVPERRTASLDRGLDGHHPIEVTQSSTLTYGPDGGVVRCRRPSRKVNKDIARIQGGVVRERHEIPMSKREYPSARHSREDEIAKIRWDQIGHTFEAALPSHKQKHDRLAWAVQNIELSLDGNIIGDENPPVQDIELSLDGNIIGDENPPVSSFLRHSLHSRTSKELVESAVAEDVYSSDLDSVPGATVATSKSSCESSVKQKNKGKSKLARLSLLPRYLKKKLLVRWRKSKKKKALLHAVQSSTPLGSFKTVETDSSDGTISTMQEHKGISELDLVSLFNADDNESVQSFVSTKDTLFRVSRTIDGKHDSSFMFQSISNKWMFSSNEFPSSWKQKPDTRKYSDETGEWKLQ
jgi:hypothetical protein